MIPWRIYTAIAGLAAFGVLILTIFYLQGAASRAELKARTLQESADRADRIQKTLDQVSSDYEALKADRARIGETRTQTIREIYRDVQIDPGCAPPPAVVSVLDSAIADANAATSRKLEK